MKIVIIRHVTRKISQKGHGLCKGHTQHWIWEKSKRIKQSEFWEILKANLCFKVRGVPKKTGFFHMTFIIVSSKA